MKAGNFTHHFLRNELEKFVYGDCRRCNESVIIGRVLASARDVYLDPQPTGGTELNRAYSRHVCRRSDDTA